MANLDDMNKSLDDITKKLEYILELQERAIRNNVVLQTRVAEQRDAPVHAEQKCPTCDGLGMRKYGDERGLWHCYDCNGTGISNRSAGG